MNLVPFWFIVIAILWIGFFVLEGFDFGVGMLHQVVGTDEAGRAHNPDAHLPIAHLSSLHRVRTRCAGLAPLVQRPLILAAQALQGTA